MNARIGGSLIIRNGNHYGYCWQSAIKSVLPLCDYFVILEAYSDRDNTYEECLEIAAHDSRIEVIRGDWDGPEPEGYEFWRLSRLTNMCLERIIEAGMDYMLYVQGDEAWHEDGFDQILRIVNGESRYGNAPKAIIQPFHHFVGNPHTTFPFVYSSSIRMARTDTTWRADNDAWIMKCTDPADNFQVIADKAYIYHYGKLGHPFKKLAKEHDFSLLFKSAGFPDPRVVRMIEEGKPLDYAYLFEETIKKGLFSPFEGTHPAAIKDWLDAHQEWWQEFTQ